MKYLYLVACLLAVAACNQKKEQSKVEQYELTQNGFNAVPMPAKLINGDPYPTDSTIVNSWVANSTEVNNFENNPDIISHGWALWQALTDQTDQTSNGQVLRRFETWYTPADIIAAYKLQKQNTVAELTHVPRSTGQLTQHNQFHSRNVSGEPADKGVVGFVKYDPSAANHAYINKLFYASVLKNYLSEDEIGNIPDFPSSSVTLKPVFAPLTKPNADGLYSIPVWPGEPEPITQPYGSDKWNNSVLITTTGKSDPANNIYAVEDFIYFRLDSSQAAFEGAKVGDFAVLQAMHVTSRENKRWTWQTFWWSKNPDTPLAPSTAAIASARPRSYLDQGSNHYAMSVAYNMIVPSQPYNDGSNEGKDKNSLYAYNPYLEAGFNDSTFFSGNDQVQKFYSKESQEVNGYMNTVGMQTNCMSCHSQARYLKNSSSSLQLYLTDQYVPLNAKYFMNSVKLDFAWSIQGNLIDDNEKIIK